MKRSSKKKIPISTPVVLHRLHIPRVLLLVETAGAVGRGMVEGISRYATENGPWSIQYEYRALDSLLPEWLMHWRGDGIITRTSNVKSAKMLQATDVPKVELVGEPPYCYAEVRSDGVLEAKMAADHFWSHGLRHFAYFAFGESWWIDKYRDDYCKEIENRNCECRVYRPSGRKRNVPVWNDRQLPSLMKWIQSLPRPVGIYTPGDLHAVCLLEVCQELKIVVPEEIAILGRGNDQVICQAVRPTLSSLDINPRAAGYEAARLLDEKMAGKKPENVPVNTTPIGVAVRQSTDHIAISDADVIQAMQFIRNASCMGINVDHVAEQVGVSRRGLERRFQRNLGTTPKEEIMRVRLDHAKKLLAQTDKSIENIATRCGFASLAYFSRAFRRELGVTALGYRKKSRLSRESSDSSE